MRKILVPGLGERRIKVAPPKPRIRLLHGDALLMAQELEDNSVDSIVTDPPYGLKFMGKGWDHGVPGTPYWEEFLRVLKPGGHALVFGGTRTFHRLAVNIEDAGFEIRDCVMWLYGSGFPKSLNVSKAVDSHLAKGKSNSRSLREVEQEGDGEPYSMQGRNNGIMGEPKRWDRKRFKTDKEQAQEWEGWGTALKPAYEPIIVARKPLEGTVAKNVLEHGTGALNIDASRIAGTKGVPASPRRAEQGAAYGDLSKDPGTGGGWDPKVGRWPANVILDKEAGKALDEQSGVRTSGKRNAGKYTTRAEDGVYMPWGKQDLPALEGDSGGASRFFYCPKANKKERNAGLPDGKKNAHPTVKPLALMAYLVRLVTPPRGTVLDPYIGSGTTGVAALKEGFFIIGIDDDEHLKIASYRMKAVT